MAAQHEITLRQNPRKKGSAFYGGYETECSFNWKLRNPSASNQTCALTFPLPASPAPCMTVSLVATLNGQDVLPANADQADGSLVPRTDPVNTDETMAFHVALKSRGLSYWYFQVREAREIRDFTLTMNPRSICPKTKLNYPDGCMTPTDIQPAKDGAGCCLLTSPPRSCASH